MTGSRGTAVTAVGVAIVSTVILEFVTVPQYEVVTEALCWVIILLLCTVYFRSYSGDNPPSDVSQLNTISLGIVFLCLSSSVQSINWSLAPLFGPIILLIEGSASRQELIKQHSKVLQTNQIRSVLSDLPKKKIFAICFHAGITTGLLSLNQPFDGLHLKLAWLFAQVVLYYGLSHRMAKGTSTRLNDIEDVLHTGLEMAPRVIIVLGPMAIIMWNGMPGLNELGIASVLKACRWIAIITLTYESKLYLAACTTTFAVCNQAIGMYVHGWQSLAAVLAAFGSLYQIAVSLPQSSGGKLLVLALCFCPLWFFNSHEASSLHVLPESIRANLISLTSGDSMHPSKTKGSGYSFQHPILLLHQEALAKFSDMERKQSKTLAKAVTEYKRRYGRGPPLGFDKWFAFAIENSIPLLDQYDSITKSFEPFWQVPPAVLRKTVDDVLSNDREAVKLWKFEVQNHESSFDSPPYQQEQLSELLQPVMHLLPNFTAAFNMLDEPRVVIPYGQTGHPDQVRHHADVEIEPVLFSSLPQQKNFDQITLPCHPNSPAKSHLVNLQTNSSQLGFISNRTTSQDICNFPGSAVNTHGFFSTPSSFRMTQRFVPIFSTCKMSTFSDIVFPSSYYFGHSIAEYNETLDSPWAEKKDILYWHGSATGGEFHDESWKTGHRQRFVNFTNFPGQPVALLNKSSPTASWEPYHATISELSPHLNISFSAYLQCEPVTCSAQESAFGLAPKDSPSSSHAYKLLYNLDGNSFSGRFYRMLKSNSLLLHQALFQEWHDDRLVPWVHYVPISRDMSELGEVVRWLLEDEEGKRVAEEMAGRGREWARRSLRAVDMSAAYGRAFLEYARVMSDGREEECCD